MKRGPRWLLVVALMPSLAVAFPSRAANGPVATEGYIRLSDGARLHYFLDRPRADGRFPTLFSYDQYSAGSSTDFEPSAFLGHGYAYIGVNLRGTGCSTGTNNWVDASVWGRDGARVLEWIARQPWSNGHVGMVGGSFPGLSQLGVAGFAPEHLDAIAPRMPTADFYRDIAYPGGIYNAGWMSEYPAFIYGNQHNALLDAAQTADTSCGATASASDQAATAQESSALAMPRHPYFDSYWAGAPVTRLGNIRIPVFGCQQWQDGAVGSRTMETYFGAPLNPKTTWFYGINGPHGACDSYPDNLMLRFLDRYVKGVHNGFERTPHVLLAHEAYGGDQVLGQGSTTAWLSLIKGWSLHPPTRTLYPHAGGLLNAFAPTHAEASDSYAYPLASPSLDVQEFGGYSDDATWQGRDAPDGAVTFTTPRLRHDVELFGPGSVDLWMASSASDTDVQVTLTEIRPDGMEQYVERGWLRLSLRRIDPRLSTIVRPFHPDTAGVVAPLVPGRPTYVRIELMPFDHVFRAGSSLRLTVDAPTGSTFGDVFRYLRTASVDTVLHDPLHPSKVVFGVVPGGRALGVAPMCGTIMDEPCRPNVSPVPAGDLDW